MQNLFTQLKQDTQASHQALEDSYPFNLYHNEQTFCFETYRDVLCVMGIFHQCVQRAVKKAQRFHPFFVNTGFLNTEEVLNAIQQDTQQINKLLKEADKTTPHQHFCGNLAATDTTQLALINDGLFESSITQAISGMYVWLGSSMGANVILRRLQELQSSIPTNYYRCMASCAKSWVSYKRSVDELLPEITDKTEDFASRVVNDANDWFEILINLGSQSQKNEKFTHST